jgi:hypothetical protein
MTAYDGGIFDPPAPLAKVTIRHPSTSATVSDVPMLIDTDADVTLLPLAFVERLGVGGVSHGSYELRGFDGNVSVARAADVDLIFLRRAFKGRFLLIDQEWGCSAGTFSTTCLCYSTGRASFGVSRGNTGYGIHRRVNCGETVRQKGRRG